VQKEARQTSAARGSRAENSLSMMFQSYRAAVHLALGNRKEAARYSGLEVPVKNPTKSPAKRTKLKGPPGQLRGRSPRVHLRCASDFRRSRRNPEGRGARSRSIGVPRETDLGKMLRDGTRRETGVADRGLGERTHLGGLLLSPSLSLCLRLCLLLSLSLSLSLILSLPLLSIFDHPYLVLSGSVSPVSRLSGSHIALILFSPSLS